MISFVGAMMIALTVNARQAPALNNIGYVGFGYNQFTGNPHDDGFDPGLTVPIFNTTLYTQKKANVDKSFSIPDGVDAHRASSCNSAFVSKEILDENDLTSILKFSFEAQFIAVPFSANANFQRVKKRCRINQDVFVDSVSTCEQYAARILMYDQPPFTFDFSSAVSQLPTEYTEATQEMFTDFLTNFGTHVVTKVWMGSKLVRRYGMSRSEFAELRGLGFDVKLAATIQAGTVDGQLGAKTTFERSEELQLFLEQHLVLEELIGTPEDASDFMDKWFPMHVNEPAPVRYALTKISAFVGKERRDAVEEAILDFCHHINAQCEPEEPLPPPVPICPSVKFNLYKAMNTGPCTYGISVIQQAHPTLVCPEDYVMTGVQLSVGRGSGHLRFNVGCSTRFDISLEPVDWVSPVPIRDTSADGTVINMVSCPKGHYATGISFIRYCMSGSGSNTFASLQCSRSSQPIRHISFTDWSLLPMPSSPLYNYLTCNDGGIVCGIQFRGDKHSSWSNEAYRLQCCQVGPRCLTRHQTQDEPPVVLSDEMSVKDPESSDDEANFFSTRYSQLGSSPDFASARSLFDIGNVQFFSSRSFFASKDGVLEEFEGVMEEPEPFLSDALVRAENSFGNSVDQHESSLEWYMED